MNNVIEEKYKGEDVLIRMDLSFDLKGLQFPVRLAFAINKSQGQSIEAFGINFHSSHLYYLSHAGASLHIYEPPNKTEIIVY